MRGAQGALGICMLAMAAFAPSFACSSSADKSSGHTGGSPQTGGMAGASNIDGGNWPDGSSGGSGGTGATDAASDAPTEAPDDASSGGAAGSGGASGSDGSAGTGGSGGTPACPAIKVTSAVYAGNCGAPTAVNSVAAQCDGVPQCSYTMNYTVDPGFDPAPGCPKDMSIAYDCVASGVVKSSQNAYAPGEAGVGAVLALSCPCP